MSSEQAERDMALTNIWAVIIRWILFTLLFLCKDWWVRASHI
jgi:hypothetical protein